jgi:hypothetical protein
MDNPDIFARMRAYFCMYIKKENIPLNGNIRTDLTRMYVVLFLMLSVGEHYGAFG